MEHFVTVNHWRNNMKITHCPCGQPLKQNEFDKCDKCVKNPMRRVMAYYGSKSQEELDKIEEEQRIYEKFL